MSDDFGEGRKSKKASGGTTKDSGFMVVQESRDNDKAELWLRNNN